MPDYVAKMLNESIDKLDKNIEDSRVAEICSLFSKIDLQILISRAIPNKTCKKDDIIKAIEKCAENNNVKLCKIKIDCFGKNNAKKALDEYAKDNSEESDEIKELLNAIRDYIIDNGYLDSQKKNKKN